MRASSNVEIARVFEAADAILEAMAAGPGTHVTMLLTPERAAGASPGAFTQPELVEAMTMLLRMGYSRPGDAAGRTTGPRHDGEHSPGRSGKLDPPPFGGGRRG